MPVENEWLPLVSVNILSTTDMSYSLLCLTPLPLQYKTDNDLRLFTTRQIRWDCWHDRHPSRPGCEVWNINIYFWTAIHSSMFVLFSTVSYLLWRSFDVQAPGSWSPHPLHAHWAGAQLQELPPCSVTDGDFSPKFCSKSAKIFMKRVGSVFVTLVVDSLTTGKVSATQATRSQWAWCPSPSARWPLSLLGRISSLLNPICHVNYVTLLLTAYYVDHFRVVSILCTSLECLIQLGERVSRSPGSFPGASSWICCSEYASQGDDWL